MLNESHAVGMLAYAWFIFLAWLGESEEGGRRRRRRRRKSCTYTCHIIWDT